MVRRGRGERGSAEGTSHYCNHGQDYILLYNNKDCMPYKVIYIHRTS